MCLDLGLPLSLGRAFVFKAVDLPAAALLALHVRNQNYAHNCKKRPPIEKHDRTGILTCCPSATPFGLALGSPHPGSINVAQETLALR